MYAHYVLLVPAAFVAFYIAILAGGALVGTISLAVRALRAVLGTRSPRARAAAPRPPARPTPLLQDFVLRLFRAPAAAF